MRALFRIENAVKRHPAVDDWFADHPSPLGVVAKRWFDAIRRAGNDVGEVLHDGQPTAFVDGAAFAYVNVFKSHVNVGFFQGSELFDPEDLLEGNGKFMRHVKLRQDAEIDETALVTLIGAAYADVKARLATEA